MLRLHLYDGIILQEHYKITFGKYAKIISEDYTKIISEKH